MMKYAIRRWLAKLLERRTARRIRARHVLPSFEELEDRTLPSGGLPYVESINRTNPAGPVTNASSVTYTVTFSEAVTGVAASDFQLALAGTATGTVSQVTPVSGSVYTVTVSGVSGNGTVGLNLVDNGSIRDLAGNLAHISKTRRPPSSPNKPSPQFHVPNPVALGDVNGDGIPISSLPMMTVDTVSVLLGNGNGTFQIQQTLPPGRTRLRWRWAT